MSREVLLRIDSEGAPILGSNAGSKGVISLPSIPKLALQEAKAPIFNLKILIVSGSKICNDGIIWTNFPPEADVEFDRSKFYKYFIDENTFDKDSVIIIPIYKPGAYSYYVSYKTIDDEITGDESLVTTRRFYINVPPSLSINDTHLPLNSISLQSMISKWMGEDWDKYFKMVQEKGYNMIHFTPLQERGESNSPYSIYDQLNFDPAFFKSVQEVKDMTSRLESKYGILSLTDMVWNHTANNSEWLRDHPDAGYNQETAPHLIPAIELDKLLLHFSRSMKRHGFPTVINSTSDLLQIMEGIKIHVLGHLQLWKYYVLDLAWHQEQLPKFWNDHNIQPSQECIPQEIKADLSALLNFVSERCGGKFQLNGEKLGNKLNLDEFVSILKAIYNDADYDFVQDQASKIIDEINLPLYREYDEDLRVLLEQLYNRTKYLRLDSHGPRLGEITPDSPLSEPYFTYFEDKADPSKQWALANNGWIWSGNPLVDFASNKTKCYLRREVIVWGDCVKLRYGSKPEDSPYLWSRMIEYTQLCASVFNGFRIDNCHSTPLHVGEALLDAARKVNPSLYVVLELFTGSEEMDKLFVERLAINSLIREAMQAWSVQELSALLHRHGGRPIGSLKWLPLDEFAYPIKKLESGVMDKVSEIPIPRLLTASSPHALFMDCTHDNETPYDKRCIEDTLPTAALVSFCASATGTVFGFDECYPHLLDVVNEKRTYSDKSDSGIVTVKSKLNAIRKQISEETVDSVDDNEMHLHHEGQYITFHRTNPRTGRGYFLIARTKFNPDSDQWLAPVYLSGSQVTNEFCYALEQNGDFEENDKTIEPVPTKVVELKEPILEYDESKNETKITIPDYFPQGSIAVFKTYINDCDEELDKYVRSGAMEASQELTLIDLNMILYRCESEERDSSGGNDGVYNIPNYGKLVYAGLQGWVSLLRDVIVENNLGHPVIEHLRQGEWALDFVIDRLKKFGHSKSISKFADWLSQRIARIRGIPYFLIPRYFSLIIGVAYEACRFRAISLMSESLFHGGTHFVQCLAMTSVQMIGLMRSTSLLPFDQVPSMAAGLPHFSYDYMRCWGRDVFISVRGLAIATERYDEAKSHILAFASTLKHGLIPNLLDAGRNPRYNARDAAWFFLQAVQDYVLIVPGGEALLKEKVSRRFPLDDRYIKYDDDEAFSYETSIEDIIYEILSRHALGIKYREANAGVNLDSQMKDEGFNVEINPDWNTGFIHGGNQWNCGTWMDKMGESEKAGNKGYPGTPRNGADVEIIGLLKSSLRFVNQLFAQGHFKYDEVEKLDGSKIKLQDWELLIQDNFERCFYVPEDPSMDGEFDVDSSIINRRGIYKDVYKTGKPYEDYELRPNFAIAMTVAPELFSPDRALKSLQLADQVIRGVVGMKTLDPSDYNYKPYYVNSVDNDDFATSKGRNYHQGPEWVWCYGFFLRAYLKFHMAEHDRCLNDEGNSFIHQLLGRRLEHHRDYLRNSPWAGLTELTQKDGEYCQDSSPSQAWSTACLLDLYLDLKLS